nr:golgin subfamily A member 6-like protein 6 [Leptinotarsa decemlineata]
MAAQMTTLIKGHTNTKVEIKKLSSRISTEVGKLKERTKFLTQVQETMRQTREERGKNKDQKEKIDEMNRMEEEKRVAEEKVERAEKKVEEMKKLIQELEDKAKREKANYQKQENSQMNKLKEEKRMVEERMERAERRMEEMEKVIENMKEKIKSGEELVKKNACNCECRCGNSIINELPEAEIGYEDYCEMEKMEWAAEIYRKTKITVGNPLETADETTKVVMIEPDDIEMNRSIQKLYRDKYPELVRLEGDIEIIEQITKVRRTGKQIRKKVVKVTMDGTHKDTWDKLMKLREETEGDEEIYIHHVKWMEVKNLQKMVEAVFHLGNTRWRYSQQAGEKYLRGKGRHMGC